MGIAFLWGIMLCWWLDDVTATPLRPTNYSPPWTLPRRHPHPAPRIPHSIVPRLPAAQLPTPTPPFGGGGVTSPPARNSERSLLATLYFLSARDKTGKSGRRAPSDAASLVLAGKPGF